MSKPNITHTIIPAMRPPLDQWLKMLSTKEKFSAPLTGPVRMQNPFEKAIIIKHYL